jgi:hypothetical protein
MSGAYYELSVLTRCPVVSAWLDPVFVGLSTGSDARTCIESVTISKPIQFVWVVLASITLDMSMRRKAMSICRVFVAYFLLTEREH